MQDIIHTYLVNGTSQGIILRTEHGHMTEDLKKALPCLTVGLITGFPELPVERVAFAENGKMVTRLGNDTLYSNDMYTDKMLGYLKNSTDGKPFFAYLAFQVAHSPFQSPQATLKKYDKIYQVGWE